MSDKYKVQAYTYGKDKGRVSSLGEEIKKEFTSHEDAADWFLECLSEYYADEFAVPDLVIVTKNNEKPKVFSIATKWFRAGIVEDKNVDELISNLSKNKEL